ncbi:coiled-coil domain-containing protein R3HCC1L isoform X2 [Onthophagus taurus]|uniref:coiled-coil domain-containing protein R3HCC1L isoform X2 n=1 Tax=Onthophagus taurus TaxID=166361 RepID=UPI000C1FDC6B|nr:coiled-coil domain-containing protein R3HCC1L isoform X2 [Onthophagus taurus]
MEDKKAEKKKSRPAQKLYVPPAQRSTSKKRNSPNMETHTEETTHASKNTNEEQSLVIMLNETSLSEDKNVDLEKQEMERVISNINRKTRPIIKHVNVGNNDVLRIDLQRKAEKPKVILKDQQVANWEDLFNEDDDIVEIAEEYEDDKHNESINKEEEEEEEQPPPRTEFSDLEHVIELYDFPPSFKTQDLIQLYHEVNKESMYVKWCDETHALLVFSTPTQANMALNLKHDIIKSRRMGYASAIACQVASKSDLKPALRRPQTSMQTARRMITSHLGTGLRISKEEQAREREELRKAKELKKAQKQSEFDAWEGNPRPSTA